MKSTRGKLAIVAVGGIIALAGVLSGCSHKIETRIKYAKTITCEQLNIVDDKGKTVIRLGVAQDKDGGRVEVYDKAGNHAVSLGVNEDGGVVVVGDKASEAAVGIRASESGGRVEVYDKAGNLVGALFVLEDGGRIVVYDKAGDLVDQLER